MTKKSKNKIKIDWKGLPAAVDAGLVEAEFDENGNPMPNRADHESIQRQYPDTDDANYWRLVCMQAILRVFNDYQMLSTGRSWLVALDEEDAQSTSS